ncbi:MAG: cupin domain-containing protein [Dermatophilaceae bacterium]|nr:cupin domain-containing protein [Intrasporangiaceae bacterium]
MPDTSQPPPRLLSPDVGTTVLHHERADGVLEGSPTTATRRIGELGDVEVGIWEMSPGTVRDIEVDEIFVVLSGAGKVEFQNGEVLDLSPGMAVQLHAGEHTTWTITEALRKIWVA